MDFSITDQEIEQRYAHAKDVYAKLGVDTDAAVQRLGEIPVSLHCWQGDDVGGFEGGGDLDGSGIAATGNYPGKARTPEELRAEPRHGPGADPRDTPAQSARHVR